MSVIETRKTGHILLATLHRPHARNSVNFEVMEHLEAILDRLEADNSIRSFILTGEGEEAFISGGDLKEFHRLRTAEEAEPMARRMLTILQRFEDLPCWNIAAINGPTFGGGCEIILAFDFRIASPGATFGFTQGKFFLPPGWGGLTRLVEKVGRSTAMRWLAEAAVVDTETALGHNLIDRIAGDGDLAACATNWAEELSHNGRDYIGTIKRGAFRYANHRRKAIEAELDSFGKFWEDPEHRKRVEKFINRRNDD